jgi:hypothetical protein
MRVIERLDDPPSATTADWFSNTLKGILGGLNREAAHRRCCLRTITSNQQAVIATRLRRFDRLLALNTSARACGKTHWQWTFAAATTVCRSELAGPAKALL